MKPTNKSTQSKEKESLRAQPKPNSQPQPKSQLKPRKPIDRNDPQYIMYRAMPFKRRKMSFADWIYRNKLGVVALVLVFVTMFFTFASVRINIMEIVLSDGFFIEAPPEEEKVKEEVPEEKEKIPERIEQTYEDVKNVSVNRGAKLDAGLKDDKGTNANDIYEEAKAVQDRLDANRASNAKAAAEAEAMMQRKPAPEKVKGKSDIPSDQTNVKGKVTVSYELDGRRASYLPIPAYKCEGGGEVVINIVVDDNGDVISADVDRTSSTRNRCVNDTALEFARSSRFQLNSEWESKHKGTITYIFLNQ